MAMPFIDPLPPAPTPADPEDVFDEKAYETVAALAPFVEQTNALALAVEAEATRSESEADRSQAQVNVATTEANRAQAEAERAKDEADRAEQARDDAVVVVTDGQGSLTPAPGKFPVAGTSGTIKQDWIENLQFELDALRVVRNKLMYGDGPYPVLDLQFQGAKKLDPRATFTRSTPDWDERGNHYEIDEPVLTDKGLWHHKSRTNLVSSSSNLTRNWRVLGGAYVDFLEGEGCSLLTVTQSNGYTRFDSSLNASTTYTLQILVNVADVPENHYVRISLNQNFFGESRGVYLKNDGTYTTTGRPESHSVKKLGHDWYSVTVTHTSVEIAPETGLAVYLDVRSSIPSEGGYPISIRVKNIQLEEGTAATPLIPTEGSQVTVASSDFQITKSSLLSIFNPREGALFLNVGVNRYMNGGNLRPYLNFGFLGSDVASRTGSFGLTNNGVAKRDMYGQLIYPSHPPFSSSFRGNPFKHVLMYGEGEVKATMNDEIKVQAEGLEDIVVFMKESAERIFLSPLTNGYVKELRYYDVTLSNDQLQELTA